MEMNSLVASSLSTQRTTTVELATQKYISSADVNGRSDSNNSILHLFNSSGGLKKENVTGSSKLLASLTLKHKNEQVNTQQQQLRAGDDLKISQNNIYAFIANAASATLSSSTTATIKNTSSSNASSSLTAALAVSSTTLSSSSLSTVAASTGTGTGTGTTNTKGTTASGGGGAAICNINGGSKNNAGPLNSSSKHNFQIPSDILDDLASRFIINVPDMELSNLIRICFQIELAHWFYLDFFCVSEEVEKKLHPCGMKNFAMQLFQHIPFLHQHLSSVDKILEDWKNYKLAVPTFGAILISTDLNYCLLVQSYFAKSSWGFPKGKVNENEDPVHCATREVFEETGYDITELIVPNDYIEAVIHDQYTRLYIVRNVSLDTQFSPRTRNEIKCCDWFPIDSLPTNKNDAISKAKLGINANSFFMIMPFVKRLKKWVNEKRSGIDMPSRRKHSGGNSGNQTAVGSPPITSSPPLTTAATAGNNQKHSNVNNSNKKNKQQQQQQHQMQQHNNNDDKNNALIIGANGNGCNGGLINATNTFSANNNGNNSTTSSANNRSKRQRHKSMGDLDGFKTSNSNNVNHGNSKTTTTVTGGTTGTTCTHPNSDGSAITVAENNNNNGIDGKGGSNRKRNSAKSVAAGSNNGTNNNNNNNSNNSIGGNSTTKRQLFNGQTQNGEKNISSFDLIRKEKQQQMKAAAQAEKMAKAQKQQQTNNGRVRAKSQGDKMCMQQQNNKYNNNGNNTNNNNNNNYVNNGSNGNPKHRIQKQQSMIVTNSNANNNSGGNGNVNGGNYNNHNHINNVNNNRNNINITNNNNNNNSNNGSTNNNSMMNTKTSGGNGGHKTPPPISGSDLLALAAATASIFNGDNAMATTMSASAPASAQKPTRPSSVSLHFATPPSAATMQKLQRMASGTNLRGSNSKRNNNNSLYQQQQMQQQQRQQQLQYQQQPQRHQVKFTPSFNSWTNFSFTKNFIANVFC